jgi:hypothetical protein
METINRLVEGRSLPETSKGDHALTPKNASYIGGAVGLGVGLLVSELVVPGIIFFVLGALGYDICRQKRPQLPGAEQHGSMPVSGQ